MRFTKSLLRDLCYEDPTCGINTVISDWEIYVAKEKKAAKTEGETDIAAAECGDGSRLNRWQFL